MSQKRPNTGRFRPARDRLTRLTVAAVGALAAGSLIGRRAAHSPDRAGNATTDTETTGPTERATPVAHAMAQTITVGLRRNGAAAASRLNAAGRAAWRELLHPGLGTRTGPDPAAPSAGPPQDTGTEGNTGAQHAPPTTDQTRMP